MAMLCGYWLLSYQATNFIMVHYGTEHVCYNHMFATMLQMEAMS